LKEFDCRNYSVKIKEGVSIIGWYSVYGTYRLYVYLNQYIILFFDFISAVSLEGFDGRMTF
jgi:hypothetical protein